MMPGNPAGSDARHRNQHVVRGIWRAIVKPEAQRALQLGLEDWSYESSNEAVRCEEHK